MQEAGQVSPTVVGGGSGRRWERWWAGGRVDNADGTRGHLADRLRECDAKLKGEEH